METTAGSMLRRRNRTQNSVEVAPGTGATQPVDSSNNNRIPRGRQADDDDDPPLDAVIDSSDLQDRPSPYNDFDEHPSPHHPLSTTTTTGTALLRNLWVLLHIVGVGWLIYGVILSHHQLFHHEECDMTYSRRVFFPIKLSPSSKSSSNNNNNSPYQLYQFLDARDARFKKILALSTPRPLVGKQGCWNVTHNPTAVLYIPGHGGSYEQSRSLGAHGLQWTAYNDDRLRRRQIQTALLNHDMRWSTDDLRQFVYPVYALDFQEEGTGLHGIFVQQQADFVAQAIRQLVASPPPSADGNEGGRADGSYCQYQSILVVAHSMGGYAARLAYKQNHDIRPFVHNLITLGTPHSHPVLALDPSIHSIYQEMASPIVNGNAKDSRNHLSIVSIAGGLRDEMIPPEYCQVGEPSSSIQQEEDSTSLSSLSLLASSIMRSRKSWQSSSLGMDHRAIVWCHNLLDQVRRIIFWLGQADRRDLTSTEKAELVRKAYNDEALVDQQDVNKPNDGANQYQKLVQESHGLLHSDFGWWNAVAMEAGFLYNADVLVEVYIVLGCLYLFLGSFCQSIKRTASSIAACTTAFAWLVIRGGPQRLSVPCMALLSISAHALFWLFLVAFHYLQQWRRTAVVRQRGVARVLFGLLLSVFVILNVVPGGLGRVKVVALCMGFGFYSWLLLTQKSSKDKGESNIDASTTFAAWTFPLLPVLATGNIYANWKRPNAENVSGNFGLQTLLLLCCLVYLVPPLHGGARARGVALLKAAMFGTLCASHLFHGLSRTELNPGGPVLWSALAVMAERVLQ